MRTRTFLPSAFKHYPREDIEHALRNAVEYLSDEQDGNDRVFIIGPRRNWQLIEVGIDRGEVFHASDVSPKHRRPERRP